MLDRLGGLLNLDVRLTDEERKAIFAETALRVSWNATTRVAKFSVDLAVRVSDCVGGGLGTKLHGGDRLRNSGFQRLNQRFQHPLRMFG
jgi:hypothetical protein